MRLAITILVLMMLVSAALALQPTAETTVQLSNTQDTAGEWINPVEITVIWGDVTRDEIPAHDPFDYDITQHWHIAYKLKFYGFTFDRTEIGKYAVRISFDGNRYGEYGECETKVPEAPVHQ